MKALKILALVLAAALGIAAAALIAGCASFATNAFRAEQTAVALAFGAYDFYTNGLATGTIKVDTATSNSIRADRLDFAAAVSTLDALRAASATNSTVQPQVTAMLSTLGSKSSNFVYRISLTKGSQ